jgi:DNA invertase Pin-like site-specific DNA recombinase
MSQPRPLPHAQRVAIYARFSSENQRDASIEDQIRICRVRAEREGWVIAETFADYAISGSTTLRPGYQALMSAMRTGQIDLVLSESLDRLSRDQEHVAGFHKAAQFAGVRILTLSEGEISELHVGLKGTMGALYLKDLADKTRRGLEGRVRQGRSGGGRRSCDRFSRNSLRGSAPSHWRAASIGRESLVREAACGLPVLCAARQGGRRGSCGTGFISVSWFGIAAAGSRIPGPAAAWRAPMMNRCWSPSRSPTCASSSNRYGTRSRHGCKLRPAQNAHPPRQIVPIISGTNAAHGTF